MVACCPGEPLGPRGNRSTCKVHYSSASTDIHGSIQHHSLLLRIIFFVSLARGPSHMTILRVAVSIGLFLFLTTFVPRITTLAYAQDSRLLFVQLQGHCFRAVDGVLC